MKAKKKLHFMVVLLIAIILLPCGTYGANIEAILPSNDGSDAFQVQESGGISLMDVLSDGKVGIGTTTPKEIFQLGDRWTFSDGGWKVMSLNSFWNGVNDVRIATGPSAAMAYTDIGDILFRTASSGTAGDLLDGGGFSTWVTPPFIIKNDGSVGVGTSSPARRFEVFESDASTHQQIISISSVFGGSVNNFRSIVWSDEFDQTVAGIGSVWDGTSNNIHFHSQYNGGVKSESDVTVSIMGTGNVGIGTTTPGAKLEIGGQVKITGGSPGANKVLTSDAVGLATWAASTSGGDLSYGSSATSPNDAVFVNDSGNVGIGTTGPNPMGITSWGPVLTVGPQGTNNAGILELQGNMNVFDGAFGAVVFRNPLLTGETSTGLIEVDHAGANDAGNMKFWTRSTGTIFAAERMRITSTGDVGIGTTSPSGRLDVEGGDVFIGTGTLTNASASEDLSVTGNLEVDGMIYGDGTGLTGVSVSGDIKANNGTVLAPSISFSNDPDSGMYRPSIDRIGFSAGGSNKMTIDATGVTIPELMGTIIADNGTALSPSISFSNNPDTGMYRPSIDRIGFSAGGINKMNIDSVTGVTIPGLKGTLLADNGTALSPSISFSNNPDTGMYRPSIDRIGFSAGGINKMNIDSVTGVTIPGLKGTLLADNGTALSPSISFSNDPDTGMYRPFANRLGFSAGGINKMNIDSVTGVTIPGLRGTLIADNGTALSPSISFSNDPDTGMYRPSIDRLGFSASGSNKMTIDATGVTIPGLMGTIRADNGTVLTPSVSFSNDPDTGMYRPSIDRLGFSAGGSNKMTIDATTGVTIPGLRGTLIANDGTVLAPSISFSNDTDTGIYRPAINQIGFSAGGLNRMSISSTGNVGIGTTTPDHDLEIGTGTFSEIDAGENQFTTSSSREYKENIVSVQVEDILDKISSIPVNTYDFREEYRNGNEEKYKDRLGLIAEDFHKVFARGSDKEINGQEVQMALWLAVQKLTTENSQLRSSLAALAERQESVEGLLLALSTGLPDEKLSKLTDKTRTTK